MEKLTNRELITLRAIVEKEIELLLARDIKDDYQDLLHDRLSRLESILKKLKGE
jgi:hypothetical protein